MGAVAVGAAALIVLGDNHPKCDRVMTMEAQAQAQALARACACGKAHLLHLEPEDLVALTIDSAAMARIPLAGTNPIPGEGL